MIDIDDLPDNFLYDGSPDSDINDFITAVKWTLDYWIKIHTDAHWWAREWVPDGDLDYMLNNLDEYGVIDNKYFSFDARTAILSTWAKNHKGDYVICNKCGSIWDKYYFGCDCSKKAKPIKAKKSDLLEFAQYGVGSYDDLYGIDSSDLWGCLVKDGFPVYRSALKDYTETVEDDIQESLKDIDAAEATGNPFEILAAVLQATQVYHVHGEIMSDYGERANVSSELIDDLRNNGWIDTFGEDAYNEFINQFETVAV